MIHKLDIIDGHGQRIRILAAREHRRVTLADFDCLVLGVRKDRAVGEVARFMVNDFPRALGTEGLFAFILDSMSRRGCESRVDEFGRPVPMPDVPPGEWLVKGREFVAMARECFVLAGVNAIEFIEPATAQLASFDGSK